MKSPKSIQSLLVITALLLTTCAGSALADGRHHRGHRGGGFGVAAGLGIGLGIGVLLNPFPSYYGRSYYSPSYYGPTYYGPATYPSSYYSRSYYPERTFYTNEVVITQAPETVYIERSNSISPSQPMTGSPGPESAGNSGDWYYCHNPDGFYPAIRTCPSGWQRVSARPADR